MFCVFFSCVTTAQAKQNVNTQDVNQDEKGSFDCFSVRLLSLTIKQYYAVLQEGKVMEISGIKLYNFLGVSVPMDHSNLRISNDSCVIGVLEGNLRDLLEL